MRILSNIVVATAVFWSSVALAQSSPGFTYGQVPTAGQWNSYFSAKQDTLGYTPLNQAGGTMTGKLTTVAPTTSAAGFRLLPGLGPITPSDGDLWVTSSGLFVRINGATIGPLAPISGTGFAATSPLTVNVSGGVATYGINTAFFAQTANNLSDLASATTARSNLGLGPVSTVSTVPVGNGGTGVTSLTSNGVLLGNSTSPVSATAAMTNGQILVGQTSAAPLPKTISGDGTVAASGALTVNSVNGHPLGVAASNVVQLNASSQLPAVDGSLLTGVLSSGGLVNVQVFKTSGTYTRSAGVTSGQVIVIGGGGAGGGSAATASNTFSIGGGGGSGAMCVMLNYALPASAAVVIGAGGTGVSAAAGNNGAASTFNSTCTAAGGSGGQIQMGTPSFTATAGGGGATGVTGTIDTAGQPGNYGTVGSGTANGGQGGSTLYGGGGTGVPAPQNGSNNGVAGQGFGAGGGGAGGGFSQTAKTGGAGANGIVIVYEYR